MGAEADSNVVESVKQAKAVLENGDSEEAKLIETLHELEKLGPLPTAVLRETMVGKSVNTLAKSGKTDSIRDKARKLVASWRTDVQSKKRKSSDKGPGATDNSEPPLKRGVSTSSVVSDSQESQPKIERSDSTLSTMSQSPAGEDDAKIKQRRDKVKQKFLEALGKQEQIKDLGDEKESAQDQQVQDFGNLAAEIEQAFYNKFQKATKAIGSGSTPNNDAPATDTKHVWDEKAYMNQARSVLYNLKDAKNVSFRFKVTVGFFKPDQIPSLTPEQMASDEKNAERQKMREDAMAEIDQGWALKNGAARISGMFTCGKCKGTKTTYFQMQTRSSDEPMTTFVTCITCNNRWKFC
eukprot:gnl/MRDRNA2_/MRDRNA2_27456_c0_seq1.p1 gnl/MRDRNA2_/MRDRNA2_27456_c0~~gnl/MRDRNA2_/MRDRNA2_27456_c0_seq1.p1  ORF type:complete len:352 (+),score=87.07 gnl/MRDRNA2_/MRDRNA2_27456_c0_seq1:66-1121(+)